MNKNSASSRKSEPQKFVGLDVHKETIAVAVADRGREAPRSLGVIRNDLDELRKVLRRLGSPASLEVCYEAGPCGYVVYRFLQRLKIECTIVAPSLIPRKPGDRIKTDRRDALALARLLRSGELTATWVPDPQHEALRDLVRAREDAVEDHLRARHRLGKFLLRLGIAPPAGVRAWTVRHRQWLDNLRWQDRAQELVFSEYRHNIEEIKQRVLRLEKELGALAQNSPHAPTIVALQAMRGVKLVTAASIVSEIGDIGRFQTPRQLMAYAGLVPSEHSSGNRVNRGNITKNGNAHLRRVIVEAAWHTRHRPLVTPLLRQRQRGVLPQVCTIAWNAQQRLYKRYCHLTARGKSRPQAVVAIAREFLGFIWAIGQVVKASQTLKTAA
ncbi:MAG TPA: IS110 family transposase [Candidatus Baltobacteraceae bacterium]|nr:IS110 family transposase [Candidatus Baltobacteraceae bacterium]